MSTRKRSTLLFLLVPAATLWLTSGGSAGGTRSASIQATAHVEASLGLTDARVERSSRNEENVSGSHLYWLYYPRPDGVLLQLERTSKSGEACSVASSPDVVTLVPEILRRYPQVSLVDLSGVADACDSSGAVLTLTLIFTNN